MKKNKILLYGVTSFVAAGLLGVGVASARGFFFSNASPDEIASRQIEMFEKNAKILGISVDEVKNYWSEGKRIKDIAEERGITTEQMQERMKNLMVEQMKSRLQILVEKGVITQSQADKHLSVMQNNNMMKFGGKKGGLRHMGFWF